MALFSQKMYQHILSKTDLIYPCGDLSQLPLGTYIVKIGRKKPGQLLDQIIDRRDVAV